MVGAGGADVGVGSLRPVSGTTDDVIDLVEQWLAEPIEPEPLSIETSGTTGAPKRVRLSRRAMLASADATHARLGGPNRWTLLLPPTYVAGVQVILRSLRAGHRPDTELTGRGYLSLVPTQLVRLIETDPEALASYAAVLLGGAPIDPALRAKAESIGVRIVATYGMTETSGGCVYDGRPLGGVQVSLTEDQRIRIKGQILFDGYDDGPATLDEGGWFVTSDLGSLEDGLLRVLGRADDVINSGGVKVPAAVVRERLLAHPQVADAEVLGTPDPEWGEQVTAFVCGSLTLDEARDWVAADHPRTWAPRRLVCVDGWPLNANGKIDREALRRLV